MDSQDDRDRGLEQSCLTTSLGLKKADICGYRGAVSFLLTHRSTERIPQITKTSPLQTHIALIDACTDSRLKPGASRFNRFR